MTDGRYPYFYRLLLKYDQDKWQIFDLKSKRKSGMTDDRVQLFPVTQSSMTDDSFFWFSPQNLNMTDDSFTVPTTKLHKTYQDRCQISAFLVSFYEFLAWQMTAFPLFWHKTWAWQMTDNSCFCVFHHHFYQDRWQFFFATFVIFGMTDDRFSNTAHIIQPWKITAFDVLDQNVKIASKTVTFFI